ncbi:MAG: hypothetical protein R6W87_02645 [Halospina sp.]
MLPADNGKSGFLKTLKWMLYWALLWCVLTAMIGAVIWLSFYVFNSQYEAVTGGVEKRKPLFVFHVMTTSILAAGITLLFSLPYLVLENLTKVVINRRVYRVLQRSRMACAYCFFTGMALALLGAPLFNLFWDDYFEENGYVQCDGGVLHLPDEMFSDVWAREARWCRDEKVSNLLIEEGHGQSGVEQVNEYLVHEAR